MDVDRLPVSPVARDVARDHDQGVLGDEIPNTSGRVAFRLREQLEAQSGGGLEDGEENERPEKKEMSCEAPPELHHCGSVGLVRFEVCEGG